MNAILPQLLNYLKSNHVITRYYHNFTVDCIWGDWKIGTCSKSCGGGSRTDERRKIREEDFGGKCDGDATKVESCNENECPRNV